MSDEMRDDTRDDQLDGAERELAAALRSLSPVAAPFDPIAAAFEAGRRSQARVTRLWRGTGIAASIVAMILMLVSPPHRSPGEQTSSETRVVSANLTAPSEQSVLRLRDVVLERGWGALPSTQGGGGSTRTITARDML